MANANNIFDTRNIIKETPKTGNRFLLTADSTKLLTIVQGSPLYKLLCSTSGQDNAKMIFGGVTSTLSGTNIKSVLDLSLLSCTIPSFEFESTDLNHFNDSVKHLSKFSANNDMSATFYDYINGSSTSIMLAWQSAVGFKLTGQMGYKDDYVCDMDLYLYGPNRPGYVATTDSAENGAIMQYKILNAWPRSVDVGEFSYDGAEIKKVTVQFSYDVIVPYKIRKDGDAGDGLALIGRTDLSAANPNNAANTDDTEPTATANVGFTDQTALKNSGLGGITL
jgi:hypothetical protein